MSMQTSTSIRKWQAALWLHHCYCPQTVQTSLRPHSALAFLQDEVSVHKLLKWEDLRASVCAMMNVDFLCCGKQMGRSQLQNSQKLNLKTKWNFTSVYLRKKTEDLKWTSICGHIVHTSKADTNWLFKPSTFKIIVRNKWPFLFSSIPNRTGLKRVDPQVLVDKKRELMILIDIGSILNLAVSKTLDPTVQIWMFV